MKQLLHFDLGFNPIVVQPISDFGSEVVLDGARNYLCNQPGEISLLPGSGGRVVDGDLKSAGSFGLHGRLNSATLKVFFQSACHLVADCRFDVGPAAHARLSSTGSHLSTGKFLSVEDGDFNHGGEENGTNEDLKDLLADGSLQFNLTGTCSDQDLVLY